MFEINLVIVIPHNGTCSDNGRKPELSVILWPIEGQNLANVAQKWVNSEHSRIMYTPAETTICAQFH